MQSLHLFPMEAKRTNSDSSLLQSEQVLAPLTLNVWYRSARAWFLIACLSPHALQYFVAPRALSSPQSIHLRDIRGSPSLPLCTVRTFQGHQSVGPDQRLATQEEKSDTLQSGASRGSHLQG